MNGHAGLSSVESSLVVVDMPVREKKAAPKRASKEDNSLYLVSRDSSSYDRSMLT
jgi:nuclear pore complex protein Nup133